MQAHPVHDTEPIEYMTTAWDGDNIARMLDRLNELGAQGWKVCAPVHAKAGSDVIGTRAARATPGPATAPRAAQDGIGAPGAQGRTPGRALGQRPRPWIRAANA